MRKILAVLFILAACSLAFYQKQTAGPGPDGSAAQRTVVLPGSAELGQLQNILPHAVFKDLVQPFLEKSRSSGLTAEELDDFLDELEKIGDALGGKARSTVTELIDHIDPERKNRGFSGTLRNWVGEKAGQAREGLPSWSSLLKGTLQALEKGVAFLLNKTADLLEGK